MIFESQDQNYEVPQPLEWGWDPVPDACPLLAMGDPLDMFSLPMTFTEGYQPEITAHDWPELAPLCPDFSHFNDYVIDNLYNNVNLDPGYQDLEFEEEMVDSEFNPMDYLAEEAESEPSVTSPNEVNVSMLNLWEDEPGAKLNPWMDAEVVSMMVGNEEWTVNKAAMEARRPLG